MRSAFVLGLACTLALALSACKDGVVDIERFGSIQGTVIDFDTGAPIPSAGITTSPATDAITADADGRFTIDAALVGTYTLTATRVGYDPGTVTVAVRDGAMTRATVFLREEDDDNGTSTDPDFGAEVLGFTNEPFTQDSSFVTVEYRALNRGDVDIAAYEIYFRIETDRGPFYQEVQGTELAVGERDLGTFRKRLLGATAQSVIIDDTDTNDLVGPARSNRASR